MRIFPLAVLATVQLLAAPTSRAGSATWQMDPANSNWNNPHNWTPSTVPNGPGDIATFQSSSITSISLAANVALDSAVFPGEASAFTISLPPGVTMSLSGEGVVSAGEVEQIFQLKGSPARAAAISFTNNATAGVFTVYQLTFAQLTFSDDASAKLSSMDVGDSSVVTFADNSTADSASLNLFGPARAAADPGEVIFMGNSSAGSLSASILGGERRGQPGGRMFLQDNATAETGSLSARGGTRQGAGGGSISFLGNSSAGEAALLAEGGKGGSGGAIYFSENSTADSAFVFVDYGDSRLDISGHAAPGMGIGSVEGIRGEIYLGANALTIGANDRTRSIGASISDGGVSGGSGGSLIKIGSGDVTLRGASTYTGGTLIEDGSLIVANKIGSGTGSGPVRAEGTGSLLGTGTIAGSVIVSGNALLSPGLVDGKIGKLTILGSLTFDNGLFYYGLNLDTGQADTVVANGAEVSSCDFGFELIGSKPLINGTVFTVIDNTSDAPIMGTFPFYADGAILTLPNNSRVQLSYEGGDGNDITLTVVP